MARITGTVTQGGADAFAEGEIQTALQGQTRNAYKISSVSYEFTFTTFPTAAVANQDLDLCLSRRSKAAMPLISDADVIKKWSFGAMYLSGVAAHVGIPNVGIWVPELETVVVEDPLYLQIDSTATGLAITGLVAIEYELVTISEVDRLTLLTQSLV